MYFFNISVDFDSIENNIDSTSVNKTSPLGNKTREQNNNSSI